jgi:hypothetical protein
MLSTIKAATSGSDPYLTLTYVSTAQEHSTTTLTHPSGVQAGDICILFLFGYDNDAEEFLSTNKPSSFTHIMTTPDIGTIQTSITASYGILSSTNSLSFSQPGMDAYGHVAFYYRVSNGTLGSIVSLPGETTYATGSTTSSISIPAVESDISYVSFVGSASNADGTYNNTDMSIQRTQYADTATTAAFGTFDIGTSNGPVGIGSASAEGFTTSSRLIHLIGGRLGFVKAEA